MGGSIGVRPAEDHGSVFWVRLPLVEVQPRAAPSLLKNKRIGLANTSPVIAAD
jgi:hypothetical protein